MKKTAAIALVLAGLIYICGLFMPPKPAAAVPDGIEVHFIDVGQGDCILLRDFEHAVLIDAGPYEKREKVISYLRGLGINKLDIVVATHPHEDHIGGLEDIIRRFPTETIVMPKVSANTKTFESLLDEIEAQSRKIKAAQAGLVLSVGGMKLTVLSPPKDAVFEEINNYSAVIRMEFSGKSFLFCGDAEKEVEEQMVKDGLLTKCDVLKVAHHGSKTSTTEAFLDALTPGYAVISVGKGNLFSHPSRDVLRRLEKAGISIFRTDADGDIVCTVDTEGNIAFSTKKGAENAA